jgi:hypothetical protein
MQIITRKTFIKNACLATTACLCGFGSIAAMAGNTQDQDIEPTPEDKKVKLVKDWISTLMENLQSNLSETELRPLVKQSAVVHYTHLKMDEMLAEYIGDIDKFVVFISNEWEWKIEHNKETKTIIANENKNFCVCPIMEQEIGNKAAICYCSEGFAELMFSKVIGKPVNASVISSVRRGDKTCKYEIIY